MRTLLTQWWDKIWFRRFDTFDKKLEALSDTLELADPIRQAIEKGTVSEEEGKNLKVRLLREAETLTGIGATVPLGEHATIDQRQMLTEMRNTKLLGTGEPLEEKDEPAPEAGGRKIREE